MAFTFKPTDSMVPIAKWTIEVHGWTSSSNELLSRYISRYLADSHLEAWSPQIDDANSIIITTVIVIQLPSSKPILKTKEFVMYWNTVCPTHAPLIRPPGSHFDSLKISKFEGMLTFAIHEFELKKV